MKKITLGLLMLCALGMVCIAEIPSLINLQGKLFDTSGNVAPDGQYNIDINVYKEGSAQVSMAQSIPNVPVKNGTFSTSFNFSLGREANYNDKFEVEVKTVINEKTVVFPKQKINSVLYAINSSRLEGKTLAEIKAEIQQPIAGAVGPKGDKGDKGDPGSFVAGSIPNSSITSAMILDGTVTPIDLDLSALDSRYIQKSASGFDIKNSAGNSILFLSNAGRLGIGTNDPNTTLDVRGDVLISGNIGSDKGMLGQPLRVFGYLDASWGLKEGGILLKDKYALQSSLNETNKSVYDLYKLVKELNAAQSTTGSAGPAGPAGPIGPKGDKGDPGSAGAIGPKGDKGETGSVGAKGDKGDPGTPAAAIDTSVFVKKSGDTITGNLTVSGNIGAGNAAAVAGTGLNASSSGYGVKGAGILAGVYGESAAAALYANSQAGYGLYSSAPKNYLSGRLGIKTDNPEYDLDVNGVIRGKSYFYLKDYDGESTQSALISRDSAMIAWQSALAVGNYTNNTVPLTQNGDLSVAGKATFTGNVGVGCLPAEQRKFKVEGDTYLNGSILAGGSLSPDGDGLKNGWKYDLGSQNHRWYSLWAMQSSIKTGDVNEKYLIEGNPEDGDIMMIAGKDTMKVCDQANSTKVGGVFRAEDGGIMMNDGQENGRRVALLGKYNVKVDASFGSVTYGDLLVSSPTPGYAMKAPDNPKVGTIIGKALDNMNEGSKGKIMVLVTLQ